jgi:tryptophanyl-tRNA synthetase
MPNTNLKKIQRFLDFDIVTTGKITDVSEELASCNSGCNKIKKSFWHHIQQNLNLHEHQSENQILHQLSFLRNLINTNLRFI